MFNGLTIDKVLIVLVIALFLLGPERLPHYAAKLGQLARGIRDMANGARDRMRDEMGPDFDEVDWAKLDPRQYDPRRIIREALLESPDADQDDAAADPSPTAAPDPEPVARGAYVESAYEQRMRKQGRPRPAPFDVEAT